MRKWWNGLTKNTVSSKIVVWNQHATIAYEKYLDHISKESALHARKVGQEILNKINSLAQFPDIHPPDRYKTNNQDNSVRAFEIYHLRVSYKIFPDKIRVLRIRHVKQRPIRF